MSHSRSYAVAIVRASVILAVPKHHLPLREAAAFARGYNRLKDDRQAVVMLHPIFRAISKASSRSRLA